MTTLRDAVAGDIPALVSLWNEGWHEAHGAHVPADLLAERTPLAFRIRLERMLARVRVSVSETGGITGFCAIITGAKAGIDQLFVTPDARGTDIATTLLRDAEGRLQALGARTLRLDCLPENRRAAAFYTREGWKSCGIHTAHLETRSGTYPLPCLLFERIL